MLDVEIVGAEHVLDAPSAERIRHLCQLATASAGVQRGHLAIEFVDGERIRELNRAYRGLDEPTDVLSFPLDGVLEPDSSARDLATPAPDGAVPIELGDVIISAAHTEDVSEAIVHGVLHLLGMDHERDAGEMLALQARLLTRERP